MAIKTFTEKKLIMEIARDILVTNISGGLHGITFGVITKEVEKAFDKIDKE